MIMMLVMVWVGMSIRVISRGKTRNHMRSRVHIHNKHRTTSRSKSRQDPTKTAVDGPNAAVDNSKKVKDA
jgi:hypothetical protein